MNPEELFVGSVALVLGVVGVVVAIGNWDACYQFSKVRWIESKGGRRTARAAYAVCGILLIILGIAIALGFGPNRTRTGLGQRSAGYAATARECNLQGDYRAWLPADWAACAVADM